ncbi:MAG: hypothetical protein WC404_06265 [Candidatus Omnitrophota bacterium]|jgi:hypothetical protein
MGAVNTLGYTNYPKNPLYGTGKKVRRVRAVIYNATALSDGDVVTIARGLPVDAQILNINFPQGHAARTGLTDVDFGFHRQDNGAVIDKDALIDGITFASARTAAVDLLGSNVSSFDFTKTIGGLLSLTGETQPSGGVNLTATINTAGSTTGTIIVDIDIAFPA